VVLSEAGILDVPDAPVTQRGTARRARSRHCT
jgi:hypothetical protein